MSTLTNTSIFNDQDAPEAISIWRATGTCIKARSSDFTRIGNPRDTRWYAYGNLLPDSEYNERAQISATGWVKVDLGAWAPAAYIWFTEAEPMVALPAWDSEAARALGVEYDEWVGLMTKHAINVLSVIKG